MLGDQKAIERLYELYDGKIHFVDRYVGELMDHLKQIGLERKYPGGADFRSWRDALFASQRFSDLRPSLVV